MAAVIHLHLDLNDKDVEKAIVEMVEGVVKRMTRDAIAEIIEAEVSKRLDAIVQNRTSVLDRKITNEMETQVKQQLVAKFSNGEFLKTEFKDALKEACEKVVREKFLQ